MRVSPYAALLALAACSPADIVKQRLGEVSYTGVYELGVEREAFRPCGARRAWWVGGSPAELRKGLGQRSYVEVRGVLSPEGEYGHMGRYPRQIIITRVSKLSDAAEAGCSATP
ncbi:MAG TPA: hypothetical protein VE913_06790 [Longimicrobium sp.]|nr:hypothetical protein [Longimicrobium sp.]